MATITYERNAYPTDLPVFSKEDVITEETTQEIDEPPLEQTLPIDLHTLANQARTANNYELSAVLNGSSVSEVEAAIVSLSSNDAWRGVLRGHEMHGEEGGSALAAKILDSDAEQRKAIIREVLDTPRPQPAKIAAQVMCHIPTREMSAKVEQRSNDSLRRSSKLSQFVLGFIH